jgi:hypothetical protein
MRPRIAIAAAGCFTCLWAGAQVCADEFDKTVSGALKTVGPSISRSLKGVGGQRPPAAAAVDLQFDANVPEAIRKQMRGDLGFVGTIQGAAATKLHEQVFRQVDGPTYVRWFTSRVKAVGLDEKEDDPTTIAYVLSGPKMWLTPNYIKWRQPMISRVDDVFHEARHTEPNDGGWPHAKCPTPFKDDAGKDVKGIMSGLPMAGLDACDQTPLGAYGVAAIMLKNIQKSCGNCTQKVKMDAGIYGDDDMKRIIGAEGQQAIRADLKR